MRSLSSVVNSASYYTKVIDQGSAIFRSLVTGHVFENGVKRTASDFIIQYAKDNDLKLKVGVDELKQITTNMAKSSEEGGVSYTVEELSGILFQ